MARKKKLTKEETTEKLIVNSKAYSIGVDYYKEQVENRRKRRAVGQEKAFELYNNIKSYIDSLDDGAPMTISGMILASGLTISQWETLKSGASDYDLYAFTEYRGIDLDDYDLYDGIPHTKYKGQDILLIPFSELIEKFYLMHENELETRLYLKGRSGDMFALKAKHKWIEEEKSPHTVNQTLVIASPDEAQKALEMLK